MKCDQDGMCAVLVEDDELQCELLVSLFMKAGLSDIVTFQESRSALGWIEKGVKHEFIVLDLNMPDMDGIEMLKELSRIRYSQPILLLSSADLRVIKTARILASAYKLNILDAIEKPLTLDALSGVLRKVHEQKHSYH